MFGCPGHTCGGDCAGFSVGCPCLARARAGKVWWLRLSYSPAPKWANPVLPQRVSPVRAHALWRFACSSLLVIFSCENTNVGLWGMVFVFVVRGVLHDVHGGRQLTMSVSDLVPVWKRLMTRSLSHVAAHCSLSPR